MLAPADALCVMVLAAFSMMTLTLQCDEAAAVAIFTLSIVSTPDSPGSQVRPASRLRKGYVLTLAPLGCAKLP